MLALFVARLLPRPAHAPRALRPLHAAAGPAARARSHAIPRAGAGDTAPARRAADVVDPRHEGADADGHAHRRRTLGRGSRRRRHADRRRSLDAGASAAGGHATCSCRGRADRPIRTEISAGFAARESARGRDRSRHGSRAGGAGPLSARGAFLRRPPLADAARSTTSSRRRPCRALGRHLPALMVPVKALGVLRSAVLFAAGCGDGGGAERVGRERAAPRVARQKAKAGWQRLANRIERAGLLPGVAARSARRHDRRAAGTTSTR